MEVSLGDRVKIAGDNFHGFEAIVTQVMPGQKRVAFKDANEREAIL